MNNKKMVVINFERLTNAKKPGSLKFSDMSEIRAGHVARGGLGGAGGADACACGCPEAN